jgi:hypothetical protein
VGVPPASKALPALNSWSRTTVERSPGALFASTVPAETTRGHCLAIASWATASSPSPTCLGVPGLNL